jgi:hypothetical protein
MVNFISPLASEVALTDGAGVTSVAEVEGEGVAVSVGEGEGVDVAVGEGVATGVTVVAEFEIIIWPTAIAAKTTTDAIAKDLGEMDFFSVGILATLFSTNMS